MHILNPVEVTEYINKKANSLSFIDMLFAFSVLAVTNKNSIYVNFSNFAPQLPNKLPNEL